MSIQLAVAPVPTLRERRRAAATQEIIEAAEHHITAHGPHALSLRAVARTLQMTVQALYHYFPNRDALITALITKAYDDLAGAVQEAVDTAPHDDEDLPTLVVAAEGYRRWAIAHPELFQLLYGAPLRHYKAPVDGPTTQAMKRMSAVFQREMFAGFTTAQLAAIDAPALTPGVRALLDHSAGEPGHLPAPATALMLSAWGHMHGLVVLEVFGHTPFLSGHQDDFFRTSMRHMLQGIHGRIPSA
ncbi:TetR/AcrR family transcriptional regulator [Streptomyces sp. NPDC058653]|uniref:TetR/AcrR family transcriptional regulator n=1 Tax=Streptomyces sp. NPDC058653 TaxID=3346576 RepID=UPI0036554C6E